MTYIIENIHLLKRNICKQTSLLIENNHIAMIKDSFERYSCLRMDGSPYLMTASTVILDNEVSKKKTAKEQKTYVEQIIRTGCTTFITTIDVRREKELLCQLKKKKNQLLNCAIDYILCVQIPLKLLTPSFIRKCKKEKIPAIFVEVKDGKDLYDIPWGWIKESMFSYKLHLLPIFQGGVEIGRNKALAIWSSIMRDVNIPSINHELEEGIPISRSVLTKLGIYPFKANVGSGVEVTYNLFEKNRSIISIEENELYLYHNDRIIITMHKGKCIRAGNQVYYHPGYGDHYEVKVPSFLSVGGD